MHKKMLTNRNVLSIGKCIEKIYSDKSKKIAEKHNVSSLEIAILLFLHNNPDTDTARDFTDFAHMSKSCVSDAIDSLTKRGFLIGKQDENDRRYIHLVIQNLAKPLIDDALVMQQEFFDIVLNGFDEGEAEMLDSLLDRVADNIKKASKNL